MFALCLMFACLSISLPWSISISLPLSLSISPSSSSYWLKCFRMRKMERIAQLDQEVAELKSQNTMLGQVYLVDCICISFCGWVAAMSNHIPNFQLVHNIPNSFKKIRREAPLIQAKNMKGKKCKSEVNSIPVLVQQRAPGDQKRERADSLSRKQIFLSTTQISGNFFLYYSLQILIIKKNQFLTHFLRNKSFHKKDTNIFLKSNLKCNYNYYFHCGYGGIVIDSMIFWHHCKVDAGKTVPRELFGIIQWQRSALLQLMIMNVLQRSRVLKFKHLIESVSIRASLLCL